MTKATNTIPVHTTRRSLFGGAAALAILPAAAVGGSNHPDAGLFADLALIEEIDRHSDELLAPCANKLLSDPAYIPYDAHTEATMPAWHDAVRRMVETEAKTLEGLRAKAKIALPMFDVNADGSLPEGSSEGLAWSICRDLIGGRAEV